MSNEITINLGEKAFVTDPCYKPDTRCMGELKTKPGKYFCEYKTNEEDAITMLVLKHEDIKNQDFVCDDLCYLNAEIGVDSGIAGVFDKDYYETVYKDKDISSKWYSDIISSKKLKKSIPNPNYTDIRTLPEFQTIMSEIIAACTDNLYPDMLCVRASLDKILFIKLNDKIQSIICGILDEHNIKLSADASMSDEMTEAYVRKISALVAEKTQATPDMFIENKIVDTPAVCDDKGFYSYTTYGDGVYTCYYHKDNNGNADYIKLLFDLTNEQLIYEFYDNVAYSIANTDLNIICNFTGISKSSLKNMTKKEIDEKIKDMMNSMLPDAIMAFIVGNDIEVTTAEND